MAERSMMPSGVFADGLAADLCEQFMLAATVDVPDGWMTCRIGSWQLGHRFGLRHQRIAQQWPELLDVPFNTPTTRTVFRHKRRAIVGRLRRSTDGPRA